MAGGLEEGLQGMEVSGEDGVRLLLGAGIWQLPWSSRSSLKGLPGHCVAPWCVVFPLGPAMSLWDSALCTWECVIGPEGGDPEEFL